MTIEAEMNVLTVKMKLQSNAIKRDVSYLLKAALVVKRAIEGLYIHREG